MHVARRRIVHTRRDCSSPSRPTPSNMAFTPQSAITSVKRGVEELAELKDEGVQRVRRQPLRAVGIALGVGLVLGLAVGWTVRRPGGRE